MVEKQNSVSQRKFLLKMSNEKGNSLNEISKNSKGTGESREERKRREQMHRRERRLKISSRSKAVTPIDYRSRSIQRRMAANRQRTSSRDLLSSEDYKKLIQDCSGILGKCLSNENNLFCSSPSGVDRSNLIQITPEAQPRGRCDTWIKFLHYRDPQSTIKTIEQIMSSSSSSSGCCELPFIEVSLHCPLSKRRINLPIRSRNCKHLGCCDAMAFLSMMEGKLISRWKCPICSLPMPFKEIRVDKYLKEIFQTLQEDVTKIEFTSSKTWRIKNEMGMTITNKTLNKPSMKEVIDLTHSPEQKAIESVSMSSRLTFIDLTNSP